MHGNNSEVKKIVDWAINKTDEKSDDFGEKALHLANSIPEDYGSLNVRKVLACQILDPTNELTIVNKCGLLGMSRQAWYDTIYRSDYAPTAIRLAILLKGSQALTITQRFMDNALYADKDKQFGNVTAQRAYLNDMGIIKEQPDTILNVSLELTQQERLSNQQSGLNKFGFIVDGRQVEQGSSSEAERGSISPMDKEPVTDVEE